MYFMLFEEVVCGYEIFEKCEEECWKVILVLGVMLV